MAAASTESMNLQRIRLIIEFTYLIRKFKIFQGRKCFFYYYFSIFPLHVSARILAALDRLKEKFQRIFHKKSQLHIPFPFHFNAIT